MNNPKVESTLVCDAKHDKADHANCPNAMLALHYAMKNGDIEAVMALIDHGAPVNARGEHGRTPLHLMATRGHLEHIEHIVERGGDIRLTDAWGWSALQLASGSGMHQVMDRIVSMGCDVNAKTHMGDTALHLAVRQRQSVGTLKLLALGADVNARNFSLFSPLDLAASMGKTNTSLILIAHGAALEGRPKSVLRTNIALMTPWRAAIKAGLSARTAQIMDEGPPQGMDPLEFLSSMASCAKKEKQPEVLALIQSRMAMQAIEGLRIQAIEP